MKWITSRGWSVEQISLDGRNSYRVSVHQDLVAYGNTTAELERLLGTYGHGLDDLALVEETTPPGAVVMGRHPAQAASTSELPARRTPAREPDDELPFRLRTRVEGSDDLVVEVEGELDLASASRLTRHVHGLPSSPSARVTVDLTPLLFCDAAGAGALAGAYDELNARTSVTVVAPRSEIVRKVFAITGVGRRLALGVHATETDRAGAGLPEPARPGKDTVREGNADDGERREPA